MHLALVIHKAVLHSEVYLAVAVITDHGTRGKSNLIARKIYNYIGRGIYLIG